MRSALKHSNLTYPRSNESECSGMVRRLYFRDPGTRSSEGRKIKQKWTRTDLLKCTECGTVFRRDAQGSGSAVVMIPDIYTKPLLGDPDFGSSISKSETRKLLQQGKDDGEQYLILVRDEYDKEEYELFAENYEEAKETVNEYNGKDMQTVFSVYRIDQDWDEQLSKGYCWAIK